MSPQLKALYKEWQRASKVAETYLHNVSATNTSSRPRSCSKVFVEDTNGLFRKFGK